MPDLAQCHDALGSAKRVVRLSIDLLGAEAERLPHRIARALNSREVQAEIRKVLEKEARALLEEQRKAVNSGQVPAEGPSAEKVARAIGAGIYNAAPSEYLKLVRESAQFKELEGTFREVLKDFNCTPVGAWIEQNRTVLVIAGAVLAVGTATAFYLTRTGDVLTKPLAGKGGEFKLGSLELKPQLVEFTPSERRFALKLDLTKSDVGQASLTGTIADGRFGIAASAGTTVRLDRPLTLSLGSELALTGIGPTESARAQWLTGPWNSYLQHHAYTTLQWKEDGLALSGTALVRNEVPGLALGAAYRSTTPIGLLSASGRGELTTKAASVRGTLSLSRPLGHSILEFNASLQGAHTFDRLGPVGPQSLPSASAGHELSGSANLVIHFSGP